MRTYRKYFQDTFDGGKGMLRWKPLRKRIIEGMRENGDMRTAWGVARLIDANGASVSSLMAKMVKRGELVRTNMLSGRGGTIYALPPAQDRRFGAQVQA